MAEKKPLVYGPEGVEEIQEGDELSTIVGPYGFVVCCGRNSGWTTDQYLRMGEVPMNLSHFVVPYDSEIVAISLATQDNETWIAEVYKNGDIATPPTQGNRILYLSASNESYKRLNLLIATPISLDDQDRLAVYCRGSGISYPTVTLFCAKR